MNNKNKAAWSLRLSIVLALMSSMLIVSSLTVLAIPNSINIQGKLTNASGSALNGTHNFTFRIYDSYTGGTALYESNHTKATDARGVYDITLEDIDLPFDNQYYLGVTVNSDGEMSPRSNLSSSPYAKASNTSYGLNASGTAYADIFAATNSIDVGGGFNSGGLTLQSDGDIITQGDIIFSGNITILNVTELNINGSLIPNVDATFDVGNGTRWRNANFSGRVEANTVAATSSINPPNGDASNQGLEFAQGTGFFSCGANCLGGSNSAGSEIWTADSFSIFRIPDTNTYTWASADTGLSRISAQIVGVGTGLSGETNGTLIAGKVGIGQTSPNATLDVDGTGNFTGTVQANSFVGDGSGLTGINTAFENNSDINVTNFVANNTLFVNGSRVGIGTSSPNTEVQINGSDEILTIGSSNADSGINTDWKDNPQIVFERSGAYTYTGAIGAGIQQGQNSLLNFYASENSDVRSSSNIAMSIEGNGNVGIGDTTPESKLTVSGSGSFGSSYNSVAAPSEGLIIEGNVGIGTNSPSEKLVVIGQANISDSLNVTNTIQAGSFVGDGSALTGIDTSFANGSDINVTHFVANNTLFVNGSKMGIGTSGPEGTLHVHTGTAGVVAGAGGATDFVVESNIAGGMSILTPDSVASSLYLGSPTDNLGAFMTWTYNNQLLRFGTHTIGGAEVALESANGVEAMRIDSAGSIGIGTTEPLNTLHVNGSDADGGLRVTNDSGTTAFFVNSSNGRVGIGTDSPSTSLHVQRGQIFAPSGSTSAPSYSFSSSSTSGLYEVSSNVPGIVAGAAFIARFDNYNGIAVIDSAQLSFTNAFNQNANAGISRLANAKLGIGNGVPGSSKGMLVAGNISIGKGSSNFRLDVNGTINASDINVTNTVQAASFAGDGSALTGIDTSFANNSDINVTNFAANNTLFVNGSRVGIGTNTPTNNLELYESSGNTYLSMTSGSHGTVLSPNVVRRDVGSVTGNFAIRGFYDGSDVFQLGYEPASGGGYFTGIKFQYGTRTATLGDSTYPAQLGFYPRGIEKATLFLTESGNVGINTSSPGETLEVNGTINIQPKGTSALFVQSDGNVGIGTTSPAEKLVVIGNANISDSLNVTNTIQAGSFVGDGSALTGVTVDFNNNSDINVTHFVANNTLFINGSRVGIGTNSPFGNLHIKSGASNIPTPNVNMDELVIEGSANSGITIGSHSSGNGYLGFGDSGSSANGWIQYYHFTDTLTFVTAGTAKMSIDSSGKVGIGTTNPNATLHIQEGDVLFNSTGYPAGFFYQENSGRVGIGTTSPAQTLTVQGTLNVTADGSAGPNLYISNDGNITASGNMTLGTQSSPTNLTMYSPSGTAWRCGPDDSGSWTCSN